MPAQRLGSCDAPITAPHPDVNGSIGGAPVAAEAGLHYASAAAQSCDMLRTER